MIIYKHRAKRSFTLKVAGLIVSELSHFEGHFELKYQDEKNDLTTRDYYYPERALRVMDFAKFPFDMKNELEIIIDGPGENQIVENIQKILDEFL